MIDTGTPALTSRQLKETDFIKVIDMVDAGVKIALEAQKLTGMYKHRLLLC